jgi:hypothetical protein
MTTPRSIRKRKGSIGIHCCKGLCLYLCLRLCLWLCLYLCLWLCLRFPMSDNRVLTHDALEGDKGFHDGPYNSLGTYRAFRSAFGLTIRQCIPMKAIRLFSSDSTFPLLFHLNHPIKEGRPKVIHLVPNHLQVSPAFYKPSLPLRTQPLPLLRYP